MELDDLKAEWQALNAQMARQTALNLRVFKQSQMERARHGLRPLAWGQGIQMVAGALLVLVSALFWSNHLHVPHLLVAGLIMHVYGLALILFSARMQILISRVDYSAPVVEIQRNLAKLRRFYIVGGLWVGLPWWLLWMPLAMMAFMGLFGADIYAGLQAHAPSVIYSNIAIGIAGLMASVAFIRWATTRPKLAQRMERSAAGSSLNRAQHLLDEIARFEAE
ncbi:MAG TPA: hypothetical protein VFF76_01490 [Holophagaceae bacterium]|jgi:hypothetical protein|nr:hypothetical protein [Holophagaceae bacterium]